MKCKKCGYPYVVNKWFGLCKVCNHERLHRVESVSEKTQVKIDKDEETYEKVFNSSDHKCEECGVRLNEEFRDDEGRVSCRWRYSHILPKSIYPKLRHNVLNFNNLCLECHQVWDFGDKKRMKIFDKNEETICKLKKL